MDFLPVYEQIGRSKYPNLQQSLVLALPLGLHRSGTGSTRNAARRSIAYPCTDIALALVKGRKVVSYNGSSAFSNLDAPGFSFGPNFSVVGRVHRNSGDSGYMFDTSSPRFIVTANNGSAPNANSLSFYDGTWRSITSASTFPVDQWVHFALCISGTSATGYLNGLVAGTGSAASATYNLFTAKLASQNAGVAPFFSGVIAEFYIYNRTLAAAEVRLLYKVNYAPLEQADDFARAPILTQGVEAPTGSASPVRQGSVIPVSGRLVA